ncbi:uncharacterized protein LOC129298288 [Prosopis cineraria]|uniref:uncharacterized protein LOC129298288 n=1 Tax=Prosopis cineraria TaxID=364024 RepID=UPI00240F71B8|nr:uncharacterized protein LOC129298288 [Prosopis cineraria]XP_054792672.1 uncharacterized protein LOC129298288 [Prosopis cineraria]
MSDHLVDCEKIFIPVHVGRKLDGHFYLYLNDLKNKLVEIWDSLLDDEYMTKIERDETTQNLLIAMENLFKDTTFTKFDQTMANNIPLESNKYDGGIFVINFMQQRIHSIQVNSDEARLNLALQLLNSNLNKEKANLYCKAECSQVKAKEDSYMSGVKRRRASPKNVGREAYIELDDSNRKVKRDHIDLITGSSKGYVLPATNLVGEEFQEYIDQIWKWIMEDKASAIGI